jgi:hypothetical protein
MGSLGRAELAALRQFAVSQIYVDELLSRLHGLVEVPIRDVGSREIKVSAMPCGVVQVNADDIRWVLERYVRGKLSGEDLSTWAGLLLAIPAYRISVGQRNDGILDLLHDLAMPLRSDYLDRDGLRARIESIWS